MIWAINSLRPFRHTLQTGCGRLTPVMLGVALGTTVSAMKSPPGGGHRAIATPHADSTVAADTAQLPLTEDMLTRMTTFWKSLRQQPQVVRQAVTANEDDTLYFFIRLKRDTTVVTQMSGDGLGEQFQERYIHAANMLALAQRSLAVTAALSQAQLTPQQWEQYRRTLYAAVLTDRLARALDQQNTLIAPHTSGASTTGLSPLTWQNVLFLRTHQSAVAALQHASLQWPSTVFQMPPDIGSRAPQFAVRQWLNAPQGSRRVAFGDGHVYVLVLTARWCEACPFIYPDMAPVQVKFASQGVRFIYATPLMPVDDPEQFDPVAESDTIRHYFLTEARLTAPVAIVEQKEMQRQYYPGRGIVVPRVYVIDGQGIIRFATAGWAFGGNSRYTRNEIPTLLATLVSPSAAKGN